MTSLSAGLTGHPAALAMASRHRLRPWEPIPWILAIAVFFAFPRHLGFGDVAGKYYAPQFGSFIIYIIMIVVLIWRPQGLFSRAVAK